MDCPDRAQWRNLDSSFPKWTAVYCYFYNWTRQGTIERINLALNEFERRQQQWHDLPGYPVSSSQLCNKKFRGKSYTSSGQTGSSLF